MKYFNIAEFECRCGCGRADMNAPMLALLDELRERHGAPLVVSSGYRCPSYNAKVADTGPHGPHTTGKAVDLAVDGANAHSVIKYAMALGFTGIGVQERGAGRFVHLDTLTGLDGFPRPMVWSY